MRHRMQMIVAVITLATVCLSPGAQAQDSKVACDAFMKNPDGSWTATRNVAFPGPGVNYNIQQGATFGSNMSFRGLNLAELLERQCPSEATAVPPPGSPPQVDLSKFADASGSIDVQKLTCGQLAYTYQEDADFLLTWYSGWSNGLAKMHAVDVAKVKAGIHDIIIYCKANKGKLIVQAIEAMPKDGRR